MLCIAVAANTEIRTIGPSSGLTSQKWSVPYTIAAAAIPSSTHTAPFSIAATASDYSLPIALDNYKNFSFQSKCTSATGTADYGLVFQTASVNDDNIFKNIADGVAFATDTTEDWTYVTSIKPAPASVGRFSLYGVASNPTDTKCWIYFNRER